MNIDARVSRPLAFRREESVSELVWFGLKSWIFKRLTRRSSNLFFRGGDIISVRSQVGGEWEPGLTALLRHFAANGHGDFLIDIGANIGLVSAQSGNGFKRVHMFEPNPHCCNLIEVNAAIALNVPYTLHRYGLGDGDKTCELTVPKHNWGGAFVNDGANSYDRDILAAKDGFSSYSPDNYFQIAIEIREAASALGAVFAELAAQGLSRGTIKIDVEGYEPVVLAGIAAAIPPGMAAVVVLESWDKDFPMAEVLERFGGRATAHKLERDVPWKPGASNLAKVAALALRPRVASRIAPGGGGDWLGDVILSIDPAPAAAPSRSEEAVSQMADLP